MNIQGSKNTARSIAQRAVQSAAMRFDVPPHEILSHTRNVQRASEARQFAYLQMWSEGCAFSEIGRAFGRDHSTVMHGVRAAARKAIEA